MAKKKAPPPKGRGEPDADDMPPGKGKMNPAMMARMAAMMKGKKKR